MHIIPAPPRRPPSPAIMPYTVTAHPAADEVLSRRARASPERRRAGDARRGERSATASSASDEPSAGQAPDDPNLMPFLAVCRFQPAADEVPAGAGASSPSRRSSRRAGERSRRPGSDWPSMMVLCLCRNKRMPLSKRKGKPGSSHSGWAGPCLTRVAEGLGQVGARCDDGERRAARERRATWRSRAEAWTYQSMHGRES